VHDWLDKPYIRWALPIPALLAVAPLVYRLFRRTWQELDADALVMRQQLAARGELDRRPVLVFLLGSFILLVQESMGKSAYFFARVLPGLQQAVAGHPAAAATLQSYEELAGRCWWASFRVGGYLLPLLVWRFAFPADRTADLGLRLRGFREHAWLYALFVTIMVPLLWLVSHQGDFGRQYPIYNQAGRSWLDFAVWEVAYVAQFFALEVFFRGWWVRGCRSLGAAAIFAMVVPYAMIHITKPYLEACGAIVAGTVLGSLSMRTGSIWAGFLVHATVGVLMDIRALARKGQLPELLSAASERRAPFAWWDAVIWGCWAVAVIVLAWRWLPRLLGRRRAGNPDGEPR
jgi:membrane protease YdiL (CAAX protease family)